MRILAAAIVFLCCVLEGFRRSWLLKSRAEFLSEILTLLNNFSIEIRCSGLTLEELLKNENGKFALLVKQRMNEGSDVKAAWESACERLPRKHEETVLLSELGRSLGNSDKDGALKLLALYCERISALKADAENAYCEKGKAFFQVGALCGAAAAIMII